MKFRLILGLLLLPISLLNAQVHLKEIPPSNDPHEHSPHFRAAILIGHTLVTPGEASTRLFVPSWGLDLEYWSGGKFGLGLHSDIELQDFVVLNENREEVERNEPLILTLDALYSPIKNLVLVAGPGLEFEEEQKIGLFRIGAEYEIPINHGFDFFFTVFYDRRFDNYATITLGMGFGKVL